MSFGIDQRWLSQHLAATPGSRPADADFEEAAAAGALPPSSLALRCIPDPLPDCILGVAFSAIDAAAKSVPLQTAHDAVVGLLRNPAASPSSGANRGGAGGEMFMLIEACDMAKSLHDRVATQAAAIENQRQHCGQTAAGNTNENATGGTATARPLPIPTVVNRSLQLLLSDGHRRVKAIEFPACPSLSALYPGVKMEIKRYRARGGMLLLGPEDGVVIHGGAVPRLVREYESKVATLAAALSGVPQSAQQQQPAPPQQQQPQLQLLPGQMPPAPVPGQHHQQQQQQRPQVQVQGQPLQQQQQGAQQQHAQQQQQQQHNGQAPVPPPPPASVGLPPLAPGASSSRVSPPPLQPPPPQAQPVSPHVRPATATATDSFALVPGQGYVRTAPPPHQHPPLSNNAAQTHINQQQPPRGSPPPTPTRPTVAPHGHAVSGMGQTSGTVGAGATSSVSIAAALGSPHRPQLVSSQNESQIVIDSQMSEVTESCGKQRCHAAAASSMAGPASHDRQQGKDGPSVVRRPDMFDEGSISMTHLIDDEDGAARHHQELQQHHKQQAGHGGVSRGGDDGEIVLASSDDDSDDNVPLALRYPGLTPKREPAELMTDGAHAKTSAKAIVKSEPLIDEEEDQFARDRPPPPPLPQQHHLPPSTISSSSYGGITTATTTATTTMSTNPYSTIASSNRQSVGFLSQRVLESQQANADGTSGPPVIQLHGFINSLARGIKVLNNEWFSLLVLFDIGLPAGAAMQAESIRRNQQTTSSAAPAAASANAVEQSLYQIDLGHTWVQAQLGMSAVEFLQLKHDKSLKHLYVAAMQQLSDRLSELGPVFVTLLMPDATAAMSASQQGQNGGAGGGGGIPVVQSLQMEDLDWTRQALEGLLDEGDAGKYIDVG